MTWRFAPLFFKYAVDCVQAKVKEIKKEYKKHGFRADYIKKLCDSYGYGFVNGADKGFQKAAGRIAAGMGTCAGDAQRGTGSVGALETTL